MNRRNFLLLAATAPLLANDYFAPHSDIYLPMSELNTLKNLNHRLYKLRRFVGYANFNIISLDEAFYFGRNYSKVGEFSKEEKELIEKLFCIEPTTLGFFGEKTVDKMTKVISKKDLKKIPHSGHFIYKGKPLEDYNRIIKDIGENVVLTSGVRNVVKQLSLYTSKILNLHGNISQASSIIAPPAYTYHAISDFDIGKKGWGDKNFTADFARTEEFGKMIKLDYISIRYTPNNKDGVRFEPWHVKVI